MTEVAELTLSELSDEAFNTIVNSDVRGTLDSATSLLLRKPENSERWYETLVSLKRSVEVQLAANRAKLMQKQAELLGRGDQGKHLWLQQKAEIEDWRSSAIRFKNGVEDKIGQARMLRNHLRSEAQLDTVIRERDRAYNDCLKLRRAILEHRANVENSDPDEATDKYDDELWAIVDAAV